MIIHLILDLHSATQMMCSGSFLVEGTPFHLTSSVSDPWFYLHVSEVWLKLYSYKTSRANVALIEIVLKMRQTTGIFYYV